jgi:hypothetical protein
MNIQDVFPSRYVRAADLNGKRVTVTIKHVAVERMGKDNEAKPVVYFRNATKGLVLNRTNAMAIAALYGPETDAWAGKAVTLYPTQVRAFGATHDAIRVVQERAAMGGIADGQPVTEETPVLDDTDDVLDNPFDDVA